METGVIQSSNEKLATYCRRLQQDLAQNNQVLLINLPQFNLESFEPAVAKNRCYYAYPPTGLQCLAQALAGRNLKIDILDLNYEFLHRVNYDHSFSPTNWLSLLEEYLQTHDPSVVGISNFFTVDTPAFFQVVQFLKTQKPRLLVAGGQNATYHAEKFLSDDLCHFICERESENKINFLFDHFFENHGHPPTPGILFKYQGQIETTAGEKDIVELKGNLIDTYRPIPVNEYCRVGSLSPYSRMAGKEKPFAPILLNRGCGVGCKFCDVVDYMGRGVRSRRPQDVLDEMEYLHRERGIGHFEFLDDDFARYKDRALQVLTGIKERGFKITWASNNGIIARTLDEELMEKIRDSGCIGFKIGVESGNPDILKKIHKPGTLESFRKFSRTAGKFPEMFIVDNYILGFPDETFGQMMEWYHFSLEMNLDWSSFAVYQTNVNYTGNKDQRAADRIEDFIPTKDRQQGKLQTEGKLLEGPEIFNISNSSVPSRDQVKQIWSTFNLVRNFILNKNLQTTGRTEKFIAWTGAVEERYPTHPYLNLFLALAHRLAGQTTEADAQNEKMQKNLHDPYWIRVFEQFRLTEISNPFPKTDNQARDVLVHLRRAYEIF